MTTTEFYNFAVLAAKERGFEFENNTYSKASEDIEL
jgi:hypothetical protein